MKISAWSGNISEKKPGIAAPGTDIGANSSEITLKSSEISEKIPGITVKSYGIRARSAEIQEQSPDFESFFSFLKLLTISLLH